MTSRMFSLLLLVVFLVPLAAQSQNESPCNQGRDPQRDPRNPFAICLPEIGRMDSYQDAVIHLVAPVGDVDHSGTTDFVVNRNSRELLLYKGVMGGVPLPEDGRRVGPTEQNSITAFLASGDWDADGHIDIAVRIQILGDTTGHNSGRDISRVVIFWGNASGNYSLEDTTRLECGAQMWIGPVRGLGADFDSDGVDDLLVGELAGVTDNVVISLPQMMIFKGHSRERWGRKEVERQSDWQYWHPTPDRFDGLAFTDQDHDGLKDIVFARNESAVLGGGLSVLYGRQGALPDTNDVQTISFAPSKGRYALFNDVTGDKIPDLLIGSGRDDFVKVYVGFRGQRLLEQYGSGDEPEDPDAERWWGRPWATIWLPRKINPNWFGDNDRLFDLGDANRDGIGDIFAFSWPYVLVYNGGGRLDSLVDALINITPGNSGLLKRVGDIDGSGLDIIALTTEKGIRFYAPTKEISTFGISRRRPPGTAGVDDPPMNDDAVLMLEARPNPARGELQFSWRGGLLRGAVTISLYDLLGREVACCGGKGEDGRAHCEVGPLPPGTYIAQLRCGERMSTTTIVLR